MSNTGSFRLQLWDANAGLAQLLEVAGRGLDVRPGRAQQRPIVGVALDLGGEVLVDQQRLACLQHMLREANDRVGFRVQSLAPLDQVRGEAVVVVKYSEAPRPPVAARRPV